MSDEQRYIDPSSGAAPQPGGFVAGGAHSVPQGLGALQPDPEQAEAEDQEGVDEDLVTPDENPEPAPDNENSEQEKPSDTGTEDGGDGGQNAPVPGATELDVQGPKDAAVEHSAAQLEGEPEPTGGDDSAEGDGGEPAADGSEQGQTSEQQEEQEEEGLYDELLSGNVGPVKEYMAEHPDEADAIKAAEADGRNRSGIVNWSA